MGPQDRFEIFIEKHIGFGIRWESTYYPLELSIAFPFVTMLFSFGTRKDGKQ